MKIYTTFTKFLIIAIPLVAILVPFVYAANQNIQSGTKQEYSAFTSSIRSTSNNKLELVSTVVIPNGEKELTSEANGILVEKVKSGIVQMIDKKNNLLVIKVGQAFLSVEKNASTTVSFGGGDEAMMSDIEKDMKVYVFGYISHEQTTILATKIVIANKSILQRK